jgi:glutathione synthase/RimK-type ligase-like ATP-grasp enzyme
MSVLIMTHSQENQCFETVRRELEALGRRVIRFDTDLFPTEVPLATYFGGAGERFLVGSAEGGDELVDLSEIEAIWNRRFYTAKGIPESMDPQLRKPSVEESRRTLFGMVECLDIFHLDSPVANHRARSKSLQLKVARQVGLEIPRTLITNHAEEVRRFAATVDGGVVCKMMSSFAVFDEEGQENVVFTNLLGPEDLENLEGLELCPMTFQESIPKALELRVTLVGHEVFAASIDSQSSERATHDWRRDGAEMVDRWEEYDLPEAVRHKLLDLCTRLGLNYGAADLILTPDGRYIFLEVNPVGEFFWLENYPGFPISRALAEVLVEPEKRRVP